MTGYSADPGTPPRGPNTQQPSPIANTHQDKQEYRQLTHLFI
jgi:hypothetical protein